MLQKLHNCKKLFFRGGWLLPIILLLAVLSAQALTGCASADRKETDQAGEGLRIVTVIFPAFDFARQIQGDAGSVEMLLKPGEEVHSYEPTPQDILKIRQADLFIYTGGENDVWVERILESMGEEAPRTLRMMDLVQTREEELLPGMEKEKGLSDGEDMEADEHVWTSVRNAAKITEGIAAVMEELDPDRAALYRENAESYTAQLDELDQELEQLIGQAEEKILVFGDRFPMRYFAEDYGLECYAAFSGCSADSEPSAATLVFLTELVREKNIPVVLSIEFSNGAIARAICEATGAEQATMESCQNVTRDELEQGETYLSIMQKNEEVLRKALRVEEENGEEQ